MGPCFRKEHPGDSIGTGPAKGTTDPALADRVSPNPTIAFSGCGSEVEKLLFQLVCGCSLVNLVVPLGILRERFERSLPK
eukprot:6330216-Amphidinium_carterae.1